MKFLGTDYSAKHIRFELDGKEYDIHFRNTFIKGTHDISVWGEKGKTNAKIISAYPHLGKRILDMALIARIELEGIIKHLPLCKRKTKDKQVLKEVLEELKKINDITDEIIKLIKSKTQNIHRL